MWSPPFFYICIYSEYKSYMCGCGIPPYECKLYMCGCGISPCTYIPNINHGHVYHHTHTITYHTENITDTGKATQTDTQTKKEADMVYVQTNPCLSSPHIDHQVDTNPITKGGVDSYIRDDTGPGSTLRREYKSEQQSIPSLRGAHTHNPVQIL